VRSCGPRRDALRSLRLLQHGARVSIGRATARRQQVTSMPLPSPLGAWLTGDLPSRCAFGWSARKWRTDLSIRLMPSEMRSAPRPRHTRLTRRLLCCVRLSPGCPEMSGEVHQATMPRPGRRNAEVGDRRSCPDRSPFSWRCEFITGRLHVHADECDGALRRCQHPLGLSPTWTLAGCCLVVSPSRDVHQAFDAVRSPRAADCAG